jgi:hypothetical protein
VILLSSKGTAAMRLLTFPICFISFITFPGKSWIR